MLLHGMQAIRKIIREKKRTPETSYFTNAKPNYIQSSSIVWPPSRMHNLIPTTQRSDALSQPYWHHYWILTAFGMRAYHHWNQQQYNPHKVSQVPSIYVTCTKAQMGFHFRWRACNIAILLQFLTWTTLLNNFNCFDWKDLQETKKLSSKDMTLSTLQGRHKIKW